jgi:hypothetical protein
MYSSEVLNLFSLCGAAREGVGLPWGDVAMPAVRLCETDYRTFFSRNNRPRRLDEIDQLPSFQLFCRSAQQPDQGIQLAPSLYRLLGEATVPIVAVGLPLRRSW